MTVIAPSLSPALRASERLVGEPSWLLSELRILEVNDATYGIGPLWVLVRTGSVQLTTRAADLRLDLGDALLSADGEPYAIHTDLPAELVVADLSSSPTMPEPVLIRGFGQRNRGVVDLISACQVTRETSTPGWRSSYANLIGAAILMSRTDEDPLTHAEDDALASLLGALARSPGDPWTLDRMAAYAHLSRSSLVQRFRRSLDASPAQVLRRVRMRRARTMLTDDSLSVAQIAFAIGYNSTAAFSRAFSADHGIPPKCWRVHPDGCPVA